MTFPEICIHSRPKLFGAAIAALLALAAPHARAADAAERPYDPPIGSRWIIASETRTEDNRPEGPRSSQFNIRAELTVEAKTPDGFRLSLIHI